MFPENIRHLTGFRGFPRKHGILKGVLERSSHTLREISPSRRGRPFGPGHGVVVTLDSNKFVEKQQQPCSIGNVPIFKPHIILEKQFVIAPRLVYDSTRWRDDRRQGGPYPPDTKAFLYYTTPPEKPRIAGEIRLRLTSSDDPASFASGSDLLRVNGQPWSRPLLVLPKRYPALYEKLREEQLIPDDLDAVLSAFPFKTLMYSGCQVLYTLNDTFILDFSRTSHYFFVITEQGLERLPFYTPFVDNRLRIKPYKGSVCARFERSTIPEHKGTRTVVLRFLKTITPVQCVIPLYDGFIVAPKEGELYQKAKKVVRTWSIDLNRTKGCMLRGLRLLWDAG